MLFLVALLTAGSLLQLSLPTLLLQPLSLLFSPSLLLQAAVLLFLLQGSCSLSYVQPAPLASAPAGTWSLKGHGQGKDTIARHAL